MAVKKEYITSKSIKLIEDNIKKLDKCIKIMSQLIDTIPDIDVKNYFVVVKSDIIKCKEVSEIQLEKAKKTLLI